MILTETKRNQIINSNEWKEIFEHSEDYPPVLLEDLKRNPEMLDFVKKISGRAVCTGCRAHIQRKTAEIPVVYSMGRKMGISVIWTE